MRIDRFDLNQKVMVVAEVGNNHEGSFTLAEQLVGLAAESGADAVKFQTFKTELFGNPRDQARFERLKRFELSYPQFEKLAAQAKKAGILFFSTPLDLESARFLNTIAPVIKIASGDNDFVPLLELLAGFGKPLILSSGLMSLEGMRTSAGKIRNVWKQMGVDPGLAILHCVSAYPVPDREANLSAITQMRQELDATIGYSDHTLGLDASIAAVALGARIIEKHFTISKIHSDFRDHQLSAEPSELAELVKKVGQISGMLGRGIKEVQPCEEPLLTAARRSIVAKEKVAKGTRIEARHLIWLRPGGGLAPGKEAEVLGKTLTRDLQAGEMITPQVLEP